MTGLRIPEAAFQAQVMDYAKLRGWRTAHFRPGMDRRGRWKTAVQGDGVGFPDTILLRNDRLVVAELKAEGHMVTPEQEAWLAAWATVGAETHTWRPSDWPTVEQVLL